MSETRYVRCNDCGNVLEWPTDHAHFHGETLEPVVVLAQAEAARLQALEASVRDDALASKVARNCRDPMHDIRWCSTCSYRGDGIADYRAALRARMEGK